MVSGLGLNIVEESCQVRLLDLIVTLNGKQATLEEIDEAVMKSKSSVPLQVHRYPVSMPACADLCEIIVRYMHAPWAFFSLRRMSLSFIHRCL